MHVTELHSRSTVLSWTTTDQYAPVGFLDAQPVTRYILQFKESTDIWHDQNQKIIGGDQSVAHVGLLKPATGYHIRLFAENSLGKSMASDVLHVQTDTEVPSGPPQRAAVEPLGPTQLLVTWRAPERDHWNGEILGYAIGFRKSEDIEFSYNYSRMGTAGGEANEYRLTGLDKYTGYQVIVLAFNTKGDGPSSKAIQVIV